MKDNREEVSRRILEYLAKNPYAKGTLDDIAQWYINIERIDHSADEVVDALEELINKRRVKRIERNGSIKFVVTR